MGKGKLERTLRSSFFLPSAGPDDEAKPWQPQPITKTLEAEKRLIRFCAKIYFHFYVNPWKATCSESKEGHNISKHKGKSRKTNGPTICAATLPSSFSPHSNKPQRLGGFQWVGIPTRLLSVWKTHRQKLAGGILSHPNYSSLWV